MESMKNKNWNTKQSLIISLASLSLLLLASCTVSAQTITAKPNAVADATKPEVVVLSFTKDGSLDADTAGQVTKVKVGSSQPIQPEPGPQPATIKFTPPANLSGAQTVELLDKDGKRVGQQIQLTYPTTSTPGASPSPSPSPSLDTGEARRGALASSNGFYIIVTLMFILLLVPFGWTIVRAVRFSRATYRSPLGLPVGSFRAILAYTLVAFLGFYILASILSVSYFSPPEFLLGIVATVIGFYFGSRNDEDANANDRNGSVRGIVREGKDPKPGASVKLKRDDGTSPYSRITDLGGRFDLSDVKPGKYKVGATLTGSSLSGEQEVTVTEGSDHEIEITLKSASTPPTERGGVQGTVTKPDNTPAAQAIVVLSQGAVEKGKATADANGKYKIENVAFGEYEVVASLAGNTPSDPVKVKITAAAAQTMDLKLK